MNTQTPTVPGWPLSIERNAAGRLSVTMSDGESVELEAFRDGCRERALELRQQAMADALEAAFAALRRLSGAAAHFLRSKFVRRAAPS